MPISQAVADFAAALEAARAELREVNSQISGLEEKRQRIEKAPPHTDDIIAVFMRGLRNSESEFEKQFSSHLRAHFMGHDGEAAAAAAPARHSDILHMEPEKLAAQERTDRAMRGYVPELNDAVLVYLLRDKIAAEIPVLVEKLCPNAASGMRSDERGRALEEIDAKLGELKAKQRLLLSEINEARKVAAN